jgi:hypothetical protein
VCVVLAPFWLAGRPQGNLLTRAQVWTPPLAFEDVYWLTPTKLRVGCEARFSGFDSQAPAIDYDYQSLKAGPIQRHTNGIYYGLIMRSQVTSILSGKTDLSLKVIRPAPFVSKAYECLAAEGASRPGGKPRVLYTCLDNAAQSSPVWKLLGWLKIRPSRLSMQVWAADADGSHVQRIGFLPVERKDWRMRVHLNADSSAIAFVMDGNLYVVPLDAARIQSS